LSSPSTIAALTTGGHDAAVPQPFCSVLRIWAPTSLLPLVGGMAWSGAQSCGSAATQDEWPEVDVEGPSGTEETGDDIQESVVRSSRVVVFSRCEGEPLRAEMLT